MNPIPFVRRGESLPFSFDRGGLSISDWTCTIGVKEYPGDTATNTRVVAATGDSWVDFLTATETAALTAGTTYWLTATLTHATLDEVEAIPKRFHIVGAWS